MNVKFFGVTGSNHDNLNLAPREYAVKPTGTHVGVWLNVSAVWNLRSCGQSKGLRRHWPSWVVVIEVLTALTVKMQYCGN